MIQNEEQNSPPQFVISGIAGYIGKSYWRSTKATVPLAKISIWQDKIEVSLRIKKAALNKTNIDRIIPYNLWGSKGLQFIHHQPDVKPFIVIFSDSKLEEIINCLQQAGYVVNL